MTAAPRPDADRTAAPVARAYPCVGYADPRAMIAWLAEAFGAEPRGVHDAPDGSVAHAEVWLGGACVMLGSIKPEKLPPTRPGECSLYFAVEGAAAVDALHARAVRAGARVTISLRDTDYGSHEFGCLDPEGNYWGFGTYAPA